MFVRSEDILEAVEVDCEGGRVRDFGSSRGGAPVSGVSGVARGAGAVGAEGGAEDRLGHCVVVVGGEVEERRLGGGWEVYICIALRRKRL